MQSNKIKLIIFDLDGVLTETSKYHFMAWKSLAKEINIDLKDAFEANLKGISRKESLNRILKSKHLESTFTEKEKANMMEQKNKHYIELISHMTEKDLFKGVARLFDYLLAHDIKIALGSASKNAKHILKMLKITHYFDYVVDPSQLRSKPAPDIFLDAMNHFNYQADECIGFEDAVAGIKAINDAGIISVGIGSKDELKDSDYCFSSLDKIPLTFIDSLLKGDL